MKIQLFILHNTQTIGYNFFYYHYDVVLSFLNLKTIKKKIGHYVQDIYFNERQC